MKTVQIRNRATAAINELAEAIQEAAKEGLVVDPMKTFVNNNPGFMTVVVNFVDPSEIAKKVEPKVEEPEPEEVAEVQEPEVVEEPKVEEKVEEKKEAKPAKKKGGRPKKQK